MMITNFTICVTSDNLEYDCVSGGQKILQGASGYYTYASLSQELREISDDHPDLTRLFSDKGESYEGRTIWVMKVSDNADKDEEDEPDVLIIGAHHGNEWIGNEQAMYILNYLTDNYGSEPRVTWLVDNRELWIVPMPNPDGTEYSQTEGSWRKNRSPNYPSEKTPGPWEPGLYATSYGTDLNRNYDFHWGEVGGSGELPRSSTYEGSAPFSELETQSIRDLVESRDFKVSVDYHSGIELILYPWGYSPDPSPDHELFVAIGNRMSEMNGYELQQGYELYQTSGSTIDWLYGVHNIIAYTIELHKQHMPPYEEIEPYLINNTKPSLYLAEIAANPELGSSIEIIHDPIEQKTDEGPYKIAAEIRGVTIPHDKTGGSMVELYYKVDDGAFAQVPMAGSEDPGKPSEWAGYIPTQGPESEVSYFFAVTYQGVRVTSPNIIDVYTFDIIESELSKTAIEDWIAMFVMMGIIFAVIWGGFGISVMKAIKAEKRKMHDYRYTYYND